MSKLYMKYLEKKKENPEILYLFQSGKFYLFIDEDAKTISKVTTLKLTNLNNQVLKCGFPDNSLDKYQDIFKNLNYHVEIVKNIECNTVKNIDHSIIKEIKKIKIEELTPIKALNLISSWKEKIADE